MEIDINKLTIKQAKELTAMFRGAVGAVIPPAHSKPAIGKYCIVRCQKAGANLYYYSFIIF